MEDKDLLRAFEPILCFAGKDGQGRFEERFYPINVEAYLGLCTLWERPAGILRWLRRPRQVTRAWDSKARELAPEEFVSAPGKARARALAEYGRRHFLRFVQRARPGRVVVGEPDQEYRRTLSQVALGMLVLAVLLLALAGWAWWGGAMGLAWVAGVLGGIVAGLMLLVFFAGLITYYRDRLRAGCLIFAILIPLALAGWAWWSDVTWLAWLAGAIGVLFLLGTVMNFVEEHATAGVAEFVRLLLALPITMAPLMWIAGKLGGRGCLIVPVLWLLAVLVIAGGEQALAAFLALTSPLRRKTSDQAYQQCRALRETPEGEGGARYTYYGRVSRRREGKTEFTVLQYYLFYAFNDWRFHGGFNFHEGDWEAVFVFLEQEEGEPEPQAKYVGLSQHHAGAYRRWEDTQSWGDEEGGRHPVIYVAVGSHANYFRSEDKPLPSLFEPGLGQKVAIQFSHLREQVVSRERLLGQSVGEGDRESVRASPRAEEHPNGRGLIVGPSRPDSASDGQTRVPWSEPVILSDGGPPAWVEFPGLWGLKALLKDESGPPGPKWEREGHQVDEADKPFVKDCEVCRLYWVYPWRWREKAKLVSAVL